MQPAQPIPLPQATISDDAVLLTKSLANEQRELAKVLANKQPGDFAVLSRPERRQRTTVLVSHNGTWTPAVVCEYGDHRDRAQGYLQTFAKKGTR